MFCTKCGKQINEGEVCSCQQPVTQETVMPDAVIPEVSIPEPSTYDYSEQATSETQTPKPNIQMGKAKENTSKYLKNAFDEFKDIVFKPSTNGRTFVKAENFNLAIGFMVLQAILTGLFLMEILLKINKGLRAILGAFGGFEGEKNDVLQLPVFKDLFLTIFISLLFILVFTGLLYAAGMIFRQKIEFKKLVTLVATGSAAIIPLSLIACIIAFFSIPGGIAIFFIGKLLGLLFVVAAYPAETEDNKNMMYYVLFIAAALSILICGYLMGKFFPMYLPKDGLNQVKDLFQLFRM